MSQHHNAISCDLLVIEAIKAGWPMTRITRELQAWPDRVRRLRATLPADSLPQPTPATPRPGKVPTPPLQHAKQRSPEARELDEKVRTQLCDGLTVARVMAGLGVSENRVRRIRKTIDPDLLPSPQRRRYVWQDMSFARIRRGDAPKPGRVLMCEPCAAEGIQQVAHYRANPDTGQPAMCWHCKHGEANPLLLRKIVAEGRARRAAAAMDSAQPNTDTMMEEGADVRTNQDC